jgi:hypothetical protein
MIEVQVIEDLLTKVKIVDLVTEERLTLMQVRQIRRETTCMINIQEMLVKIRLKAIFIVKGVKVEKMNKRVLKLIVQTQSKRKLLSIKVFTFIILSQSMKLVQVQDKQCKSRHTTLVLSKLKIMSTSLQRLKIWEMMS